MSFVRIGKLEIYKVETQNKDKSQYEACGCYLGSVGPVGFTWLSRECREGIGGPFAYFYRGDEG